MVKADAKRDYYADLELPPTADAEEIKRAFRTLAKQYHPDRNPGREVEVLAKFQAVQAAHEILSDPQQKRKYDEDRAKSNRSNNLWKNDVDPYPFRKPAPKPAPTAAQPKYQPPPSRPRPARNPFDNPTGRGNPPTNSSGAEKLNAFTRPTQQWDRAKFDEAARADAARGFANMRSSQSTPQPPQRPLRHPTASQPFGNGNSADMPPPQSGPSPGFPGMSRTASFRGFAPGTPGGDEPPAPRSSAYANYVRGERPQASNPQPYFPEPAGPQSPTMSKQRPTVSPLRHARSSGFDDRQQRPPLARKSSKYATAGGEKTNISGPSIGRSASVRNSPVETRWEESVPSGWTRPHSHHGPPPARHRSHSPQTRPSGITVETSSSESASSGDDLPTMNQSRPKAQPRRPRPKSHMATGAGYGATSPENPGLTEPVPSTNYTKIVDNPTPNYQYPPPESPNGPTRRPFLNMTTPGSDGVPRAEGGGIHRAETWAPKYDSPRDNARKWPSDWGFSKADPSRSGPSLNGLPSWAVPSSLYPRRAHRSGLVGLDSRNRGWKDDRILPQSCDLMPTSLLNASKANPRLKSSSATGHEGPYSSRGPRDPYTVSQESVSTTFSAADWDGKFTSGDEYLRPSESHSRERKSPTRNTRSRARSQVTGLGIQDPEQDTTETVKEGLNGSEAVPHRDSSTDDTPIEGSKAAAFQSGKFSAEEWAAKLKDQKWSVPQNELNLNKSKTPKRGSKSVPAKKPAATNQNSNSTTELGTDNPSLSGNGIPSYVAEDPDAMDIDQSPAESAATAPSAGETAQTAAPPSANGAPQPATNGVDLNDLATTAPFAPSATGLKDLDDLATSLPFDSRAAPSVKLEKSQSSTIRRLDLPRPPRTIAPPLSEDLTQERWEGYVRDMNDYMHGWNVFNIKMIDHFRIRQDQINVGMSRHWISSVGDGPPAEHFDCELASLDGPKAGYAAYMTWLREDATCRAWWDEANERHRICLEGLGKMRDKVKGAATGGVV